MLKSLLASITLAAACATISSVSAQSDAQAVTVNDRPAERRVDVLIDGKPFTSYIYPASLQKPVLYPIRTPGGALITRGYPLDPMPGERADHPHHVGHWFNYGDVNGYDFWGHSDDTPAADTPKMGTIVHKAVTHVASGAERGELAVRADWVVPSRQSSVDSRPSAGDSPPVAAGGTTLLTEQTRFTFSGAPGRRVIDRVTTWTAGTQPVTFKDTKEGAFGIRVARALDHPSTQADVFVAPGGGKNTVKKVDSTGVTGRYIGSDGKTGEDVWGTRGPWMGLTGVVLGEPVTLAILDHPSSYGYPTYWHARGYGLFAANPLGRQGYDPKQEPATLTLAPGESVTFRFRILIRDGHLTADDLRKEQERFVEEGTPAAPTPGR